MSTVKYSRRRVLVGLGAGATLSLAGCSESEELTPQHSREKLEEEHAAAVETNDRDEFVPSTVTIDTGESVVWYNNRKREHTVTAYEDKIPDDAEYFDSGEHESEQAARDDSGHGVLRAGDTYSHTFDVAGEYEYFCIPHERTMKGTVVVEA